MQNSQSQTDETLQSKRRRYWSPEEKHAILQEAEYSSVSAASKKFNVSTSLLFGWRLKQKTDLSNNRAVDGMNLDNNCQNALKTLQELEQIEMRVVEKLVYELRENRISAYNAACALANLVNANSKLQALKFDVVERWNSIEPQQITKDDDEQDPEIRREAERMLLKLIELRAQRKSSGAVEQS